jgi:hypothetical protein
VGLFNVVVGIAGGVVLLASPSTVTQTLGAVLQLLGSIITLGGLLWAWYVASDRFRKFRGLLTEHWTDLRKHVDRLGNRAAAVYIKNRNLVHTWRSMGLLGETAPSLFEDELAALRWQLNDLRSTLCTEIETAIANEDKRSQVIQLDDLGPAILGLLVSIAGNVFQLFG